MSKKCREAFEAAWKLTEDPEDLRRAKYHPEEYIFTATQRAWKTWQAAWAACREEAARVCGEMLREQDRTADNLAQKDNDAYLVAIGVAAGIDNCLESLREL